MPIRTAFVGLSTVAVLGLVAACATIAPERCATIDWQQQGLADGRAGFGPDRVARHREACAAVNVLPDVAAWETGRTAGLADFCLLPNALQHGLARRNYEKVCADPLFEEVYATARRFGDARYRVEFIDGQIDWRERELLTNKKLSPEKRAELIAEVRSYERSRERAIDDREEASRALQRKRRQLGL